MKIVGRLKVSLDHVSVEVKARPNRQYDCTCNVWSALREELENRAVVLTNKVFEEWEEVGESRWKLTVLTRG